MTSRWLRVIGLALSVIYAAFIVWVYAAQPRTLAEVRGGVAASVGAYAIDRPSFDAGLAFFRRDQFVEARSAFARADPAQRDPTTQYYIAYSFMRQGWGRLYHDDELYRQAQAALKKAVAASPTGSVRVDDPGLALRSSDELQAELERGLTRTASDFNPVKMWSSRP
jgi:tetratricopeptide (TPR) repeat protein